MTDSSSGNSRGRFARSEQPSAIAPAAAARVPAAKRASAQLAATAESNAQVAEAPGTEPAVMKVEQVGTPAIGATVPPADSSSAASNRSHLPTVLCVDDDERLLAGLALRLRRHFQVTTAKSAAEALAHLNLTSPFAAVVSDMRMPNVDGSTFLSAMRRVAPETTRILLSGQLDLNSAIAAVNEGEVFRFLRKPIESEDLVAALTDAVARHQTEMRRRRETRDVMALAIDLMVLPLTALAPTAAVRSGRLRALANEIACAVCPKEGWVAELAVVVLQSVMAELAPDIAARWRIREPLTDNEQLLLARALNRAIAALDRVPSTATVKEALLSVTTPLASGASWRGATSSPMPVRILHLVFAFDAMRQRGYSDSDTLQQMQTDSYHPDASMMSALT
ncbi:MAG: response regulator, partial [Phycisphaerae bacterium]|nr:response regulator [Gemmatimonadaceae bacterium]